MSLSLLAMTMKEYVKEKMTNIKQMIAADPEHSVWVSASAGTGKTKVLTDRVLRLLLSGVPFEKILCLTFTNAAASEMTSRISKSLIEWQHNTAGLESLLGRTPTKAQIIRAKNLFTDLILSAEQLSIHTIHSYCQKILKRFPFEAAISPGFKVLSEIETEELCEKVISDLASILEQNQSNDALDYVLSNLHEMTFTDTIFEILENQIYFRDLFKRFSSKEEYSKYLKSQTNNSHHEEFYIEELASKIDDFIDIELEDKEQKIIDGYNSYSALPLKEKVKKFHQFKKIFCTELGEPRKTLLYKKSRDLYPELDEKLRKIQSLIYDCDQKVKISRMIIATSYLFEIAIYTLERYRFYKNSLGCLDYDDLIYYTKELLTNSEAKDWVLYKLDGGVNHLLVDEAQDTSPGQWQIIEAIMSEFYSGDTASEDNRTVFIVGDEKQSIYSFQGADISNFTRFNNYIKEQMHLAAKAYSNVDLDWSYRSSSAILDVVAALLQNTGIKNSSAKLECFRAEHKGLVEIWPLYLEKTAPKDLFWPLLSDYQTELSSSTILANDIAKFIKNYIDSGTILPSTGLPAEAKDFMILIRRRNEFTHEIIHALKEHNVEVGGIDRMVIMENLSVQDLISIAKFALLPEDDLNLACLLRSPIISIPDKSLEKLALERGAESLFSQIKKHEPEIEKILSYFIELSFSLNVSKFFHIIIDIIGLRQILVEANGESSNDAIDELLYLTFQFEKQNNGNLQEFIYWIEKHQIEIKRDAGNSSSVRVMTVHGAKGLESPVVILADTTTMPTRQNNLTWNDGDLYWLGSGKNSNHIYESYKQKGADIDYEEYLRLLYVALTRAEDHLVVAGFSASENIPDRCWYNETLAAIKATDFMTKDEVLYYGDLASWNEGTLLRHCEEQRDEAIHYIINNGLPLRSKDLLAMTASYSSIKKSGLKKSKSPLESRTPLTYGQILHKILEDSIRTRNFNFSPSHPLIQSLEEPFKSLMIDKLSKLFEMPEFKTLVNYDQLKTEVTIGYNIDGIAKTGRIDLIGISKNEIVIIDYKNDVEAPMIAEDAPHHYISQLRSYKDSIRKIIPGKEISTKILWLENLYFMDVV